MSSSKMSKSKHLYYKSFSHGRVKLTKSLYDLIIENNRAHYHPTPESLESSTISIFPKNAFSLIMDHGFLIANTDDDLNTINNESPIADRLDAFRRMLEKNKI